ncbi:MAG: hypothetical protein HY042_05155 [Spirochaetia bacterium]|nr:hypothetical protein [Spirochaetia bacterium]
MNVTNHPQKKPRSRGPLSRVAATTVFMAVLMFVLGACSSYQKVDDFQSARDRIKNGHASDVIREIMENWDKIPPGLQEEAIDTIAEVPGPQGFGALMEIFNKPNISKDLQKRITAQMVRRDDPEAVDFLFDLATKDPDFLTDNVMAFFGSRKVTKAVPMLSKAAAAGRADKAVPALQQMGTPESEAAILEMAAKSDHPARQRALDALPSVKDPASQDKKAEVIRAIIKPGSKEPEAVVSAAVSAAGTLPYKQESYGALEDYYRNIQKPELKDKAKSSMSQMAGLDAYFVEREAMMRLADMQSSLAVMHASLKPAVTQGPSTNARSMQQPFDPGPGKVQGPVTQPSKQTPDKTADKTTDKRPVTQRTEPDTRKPDAKKEPKPQEQEIKTTRPMRRYDANYNAHVADVLLESMPEEDVIALRNRVNNVLLSYSEGSGGTADFMVRAFRKEFRIGEADARAAMAKGLRYPGSLSAIIRNVVEEYDGDDMRVYALASLFSIPRWQAALLLDLTKSGKL